MKDTAIRVLGAAAAALVVFAIVTVASQLELWVRLVLALGSAALFFGIAARLKSRATHKQEPKPEPPPPTTSIATNLHGRNVAVREIHHKRHGGETKIASDISAEGDVTIENVKDL